MGYIEQNLIPGETLVYRTRLHWILFAWPTTAALVVVGLGLLAFLAGSLAGGLLFLVAALVIILLTYARYVSSEFGVTTRRVLIKIGLVRRHSLEILLPQVEGIGVDQGILGRIFGYGTITVTGTGGTKETFRTIAAPLEFRRMVQQQTVAGA